MTLNSMTESLLDGPVLGESGNNGKNSNSPVKRKHSEEMVTTGAFMTRTTLRKLGAHISASDLDSLTNERLQAGDWVRVLSLDRAWYTAVVLSVEGGRALVHYPGWDHGFNEWIAVESRRLMYRNKMVHDDDRGEHRRQMDVLDGEQAELAEGFDLVKEVQLAMGVITEAGMDANGSEAESVATKKPGRPMGRHNRRHVGVVKRRDRPVKKSAAARKKAKSEDKAGIVADTVARDESVAKTQMVVEVKDDEPAAQFVVPEELRVARIRQLQKISNPYA
ncbi:hypothetical protein GGI05_003399, partial [Coemansia sp. RSA 2603]